MKDWKDFLSSNSSVEVVDPDLEAQKHAKRIIGALISRDGGEDVLFPIQLSEEVGFDVGVVEVLMSAEEKAAIRKRTKILRTLEESKSRITFALDGCDENDNIPWGPDDDPEALIKKVNKPNVILPFMFRYEKEMKEIERKEEETLFMKTIDQYLRSRESKVMDMQELDDWMTNFSFKDSWDELDVDPVLSSEKDERESCGEMDIALQRASQCARKMQNLIDLLATDDGFDVVSGKFPEHIAAARKKRGIPVRSMRCSDKLHGKLDEYERLHHFIGTSSELQKPDKISVQLPKQPTTIRQGDDTSDLLKDLIRKTESAILREVTICWKDAVEDVVFYMQEVKQHRFSKASCRLRLGRAVLMMQFISAAIEGRIMEVEKRVKELEKTELHVVRLHEESHLLNTKLAEANRAKQIAQRKISKLKCQLEFVTKNKYELQTKVEGMNDKIESLTKQIELMQDIPNQQGLDGNLSPTDDLDDDLTSSKTKIMRMRSDLEKRNEECLTLKSLLIEEKETNTSLIQDVAELEEQNAKVQEKITEMEKKATAQETNAMSLRLMVYYKDEVIRRLKQATMELKSSEKTRSTLKKPPLSPEGGSSEKLWKHVNKTVSGKLEQDMQGTSTSDSRQRGTKTNKVFNVSKDDDKLHDQYDIARREKEGTKRQVQESDDDCDSKLREALESERQNSLIEPIKAEEDLRFLRFAVKDETVRIQKEMKKFADSLGEELKILTGFKGSLMNILLPNTGKGTAVGLTTCVNLSFDPISHSGDIQGGNLSSSFQMEEMAGDNMAMAGPEFFGQEQPNRSIRSVGFDCMDDEVEPSGSSSVFGLQESFQPDKSANKKDSVDGGHGVNYWKSLKTALTGNSVDAKVNGKAKEIPEILERCRIDTKKDAEECSKYRNTQMPNESNLEAYTSNSNPLGLSTNPNSTLARRHDHVRKRSSAVTKKELSRGKKISDHPRFIKIVEECRVYGKNHQVKDKNSEESLSENINNQIMENTKPGKGTLKTKNNPEDTPQPLDSSANINSTFPRSHDQSLKRPFAGAINKLTRDGRTSKQTTVAKMVSQNRISGKKQLKGKNLEESPSSENVNNKTIANAESEKGTLKTTKEHEGKSQSRDSNFVNEYNASGLGTLPQKMNAKPSNKRQSSVRPFRPVAFTVKGGNLAPPEYKFEMRGFQADSMAKSQALENPELKKRFQPRQDRLKQAESLIRMISQQVRDFLKNISVKLVEILRENKEQMAAKTLAFERKMLQERVHHKAKIRDLEADKKKKEKELKNAKQTLADIAFSKAPSWKLDVQSKFDQNLIHKLRERDFENATLRLLRAAQRHKMSADYFRLLSGSLEGKIQDADKRENQLRRKLKVEEMKSSKLRVEMQSFLRSQRQTLFLNLDSHRYNLDLLKKSTELDINVKKVALNIVRRSMVYPEESLRLLVQNYCKSIRFTTVQERVRNQMVEMDGLELFKNPNPDPVIARKKVTLTHLLAGLAVRRELAKERMRQKRKKLDSERQNIFIKMSLILHRLEMDEEDLEFAFPKLLQVCGEECSPVQDNIEVKRPNDIKLWLPKNKFIQLPEIKTSPKRPDTYGSDGDQGELSLKGHKPPTRFPRLRMELPHWFPEESLFCPFSHSDNVSSTSSLASISHRQGKHRAMKTDTLASRFPFSKPWVDIPRILELEVQSGLREARKAVMKRLHTNLQPAQSVSDFSTSSMNTEYSPTSKTISSTYTKNYGTVSHTSPQDLRLATPLPPITLSGKRHRISVEVPAIQLGSPESYSKYNCNESRSPPTKSLNEEKPGQPY